MKCSILLLLSAALAMAAPVAVPMSASTIAIRDASAQPNGDVFMEKREPEAEAQKMGTGHIGMPGKRAADNMGTGHIGMPGKREAQNMGTGHIGMPGKRAADNMGTGHIGMPGKRSADKMGTGHIGMPGK